MAKNGGKLDDDVDQLFQLPLAEFTGARNTLAARLKQSGRVADANLVKTLAKPPVSAWAVNQLYWHHRRPFDLLLAAGQRFHKAQTVGKVADMRAALEARREALIQLSDLATELLSEAGHNPSGDTIRRITTTLEAISAYASLSDGPTLGRLTQDVDPPGFESLAAFVPGPARAKSAEPSRPTAVGKSVSQQKTREQLEKARQAKIAAAKAALQSAKKSLADARARAQGLESAQKKAQAELKQAEKRLQDIKDEAAEAAQLIENARRAMDHASKELETLFHADSD